MEKSKKYLVLVVDDDPIILSVIQTILSDEDIEVVSARAVSSAFQIIDTVDVHLMITDYFLANGTGVDLITRLRREKPHIPVIMISGSDDRQIRMKCLENGANVFLTKPFHGPELNIIIKNLLNLFEAYERLEGMSDMVKALSQAVEKKDTYTQGHHARVTQYSMAIYDEVFGRDDGVEREALRIGCLLHDIGKIGVPDEILKAPRALTADERVIVQRHPDYGHEICKDLHSLKYALEIIRHHHEKLDGSGYPDHLAGDQIINIVAISAIADIFDALTSDRSYRKKNGSAEAIAIMRPMAEKKQINSYFLSILDKLTKDHPQEYPQ